MVFKLLDLDDDRFGSYQRAFDASKIPDDEIEAIDNSRTLEPHDKFIRKYGCKICKDSIFGLDTDDDKFGNAEYDEARKFMIYRLPFMKKVHGKQACPECAGGDKKTEPSVKTPKSASKRAAKESDEGDEEAEDFVQNLKSTSKLMTKSDAMKEYKLSKEDMENLVVQEEKRGQWGEMKLYDKAECEELGRRRREEKQEASKNQAKLMTKSDAMKEYKLSKEDMETLGVQEEKPGKWGKIMTLYDKAECEELGRKKREEKQEAARNKEELTTKTDAMKEYKLSKEDMETLVAQEEKPGKWGKIMTLYDKTECEELGRKRKEEKEEMIREKAKEKEEKAKERERVREEKETAKATNGSSKAPKKKVDSSRVAPYTRSPSKRNKPKKSADSPPEEN